VVRKLMVEMKIRRDCWGKSASYSRPFPNKFTVPMKALGHALSPHANCALSDILWPGQGPQTQH
jgi:hypothetical protein